MRNIKLVVAFVVMALVVPVTAIAHNEGAPEPLPGGGGFESVECNDVGGTSESYTKDFEWGPAGRAPQDVHEAATVMRIADPMALTALYICEGNSTVIGWVLGTSKTEADGIIQVADYVPAGTCVDYDPSRVTSLSGETVHFQDFNSLWRRSLLAADGRFDGLKMTAYWTPCVFTDGFTYEGGMPAAEPVEMSEEVVAEDPEPQEATVAGCPESKQEVAAMFGGNPNKYGELPPNGWMYSDKLTVTNIEGFVIHTNKHPSNPGLPVGKTETTNGASIYCEL